MKHRTDSTSGENGFNNPVSGDRGSASRQLRRNPVRFASGQLETKTAQVTRYRDVRRGNESSKLSKRIRPIQNPYKFQAMLALVSWRLITRHGVGFIALTGPTE